MQLYIILWIKYHIQQCSSMSQKSKITKIKRIDPIPNISKLHFAVKYNLLDIKNESAMT